MNQQSQHDRILLVEDDAPLASMVADFLWPHGFDLSIEGRSDTVAAMGVYGFYTSLAGRPLLPADWGYIDTT